MALIKPWQNSTPFLCAAVFCTTKIDDFKRCRKRLKKLKNLDNLKNKDDAEKEDDTKVEDNQKN